MLGIFSARAPEASQNGVNSLATIVISLKHMATIAQISVPIIQPMFLVATIIVETVQTVLAVVGRHQYLSEELGRNVQEFITVLADIQAFVDEYRSCNLLFRVFATGSGVAIRECRRKIKMALDMFQVQMHMRNHENIANLCEYVEKMAAPPPPYTARDGDTADPTIPEEIKRIAEEEFDRLLPILGAFSVFQAPPTTPQITRVLALEETDVQEVWNPISSYLDLLESDRRTRCLKYLEDLVCRRDGTPSIDLPKYHNLVAQWCLGQNFAYGLYAADFWVHHVCHSSPSLELRDALMHSNIPLDPISLDDLPEIISWLEQIIRDEGEWRNLLTIYREATADVSTQSSYLVILGGLPSHSLSIADSRWGRTEFFAGKQQDGSVVRNMGCTETWVKIGNVPCEREVRVQLEGARWRRKCGLEVDGVYWRRALVGVLCSLAASEMVVRV
ncbi:hypothetical protein B0H14DRAFT_2571009 [Mycena olivaceomarginata]|nr:hypothetical protein B0H14DRAFT_2571009 [Mycena olivaceomarginata]